MVFDSDIVGGLPKGANMFSGTWVIRAEPDAPSQPNALKDNVNFYKYASAQRSGIKEASGQVVSGQWQELQVEIAGNQMRGFLNGQLISEATDDSYRAGKVGVWTKADSLTCFDNVKITAK